MGGGLKMGKNLAISRNRATAIWLLCLFSAIVFFLLSPGESQAASSATVPQAQGEYVGSEVCGSCHQESFQSWKDTAMGKAFLDHPQTDSEKRGCEACHGPGRTHAEGGGDVSAILRFGKESKLSAEEKMRSVCNAMKKATGCSGKEVHTSPGA